MKIAFLGDSITQGVGASEYFVDGLHPNDKGHSLIAEKICEFIKNDK
ncbi:MAG: hypothetical protein J6U92_07470 [Clostridia bacterium]|nr:hypothetical protein [Clostridia bacterium]